MAYITKEQVQEKRGLISALCKEYGITATVSGSNSSTLTVTIRKGWIDFLGNYVDTVKSIIAQDGRHIDLAQQRKNSGYFQVNHYYLDRQFSGIALDFMLELLAIMKIGHYDHSDAMVDYFNCAWYIGINVGEWNKPYILTA